MMAKLREWMHRLFGPHGVLLRLWDDLLRLFDVGDWWGWMRGRAKRLFGKRPPVGPEGSVDSSKAAKDLNKDSYYFLDEDFGVDEGAIDIHTVWTRIEELAGETFHTKTGKPFTYQVDGNVLRTDRTDHNLSKGDFKKVLRWLPLPNPGRINNIVRGPAYIWAILHDKRVRQDDW